MNRKLCFRLGRLRQPALKQAQQITHGSTGQTAGFFYLTLIRFEITI